MKIPHVLSGLPTKLDSAETHYNGCSVSAQSMLIMGPSIAAAGLLPLQMTLHAAMICSRLQSLPRQSPGPCQFQDVQSMDRAIAGLSSALFEQPRWCHYCRYVWALCGTCWHLYVTSLLSFQRDLVSGPPTDRCAPTVSTPQSSPCMFPRSGIDIALAIRPDVQHCCPRHCTRDASWKHCTYPSATIVCAGFQADGQLHAFRDGVW